MADCATRLAEAQVALHALLMGEQVASITVNGKTTNYSPSDISKLRSYVRELEAECGDKNPNGSIKNRRGAILFRG